MNARTALALALAALLSPAALAAESAITLQGTPALPADASHALHRALGSFSIESAFTTAFLGNRSAPNALTRALLDGLAVRTGVPAEIRFGGITADSTYWDPGLEDELYNFYDDEGTLYNTTIGPKYFQLLTTLLPAGTKVIVNLNLEDLDYEGALAVAAGALQGIPEPQLFAFEIGNEPDHYLNFTPENYTAIWKGMAENITKDLGLEGPQFQLGATAEDPLWPYDAPGAKEQLDCVSALAAGANDGNVVKTCSEHTYQYSVCDPERAVVATLPNLVNHTRLAVYLDLWQPRIKTVREALGPEAFYIGEYSSVSCSGHANVSDTFGQAMWLLDTTLYAASINVTKLFTHQGGPLALQSASQLNHGGLSLYDMWYPVANANGPAKVFPSYAAYLFVAEMLGAAGDYRIANLYPGRQANGSTITPALGDASEGQIAVYGLWDEARPESPARFAVLNMEIYNVSQVGGGGGGAAECDYRFVGVFAEGETTLRVRRMQAPGADVKEANVTRWAGQTFGEGVAAGELVEETVRGRNITVEASGAALVFVETSA
ncbi:glycoside hydrolase superfamily [Schizophyllum fasciatum]